MVDVVLIVTSVIFAILILMASVYFVIHFQHPDDTNVAIFPKIVTVLSLSIACFNVFLIPLDVGNQGDSAAVDGQGGLPMAKITIAFYTITMILTLAVVPFTVFFYEGDDEKDRADGSSGSIGPQIGYALKWIIPIWIVLAVVIVSLWFSGYGVASIPTAVYQSQFFEYSQENALDWYTDTYYCNRTITTPENSTDFFFTVLPETQQPGYGCTLANSPCCRVDVLNEFTVSAIIFTLAIVLFIGWFIFAIFGGVGLVALPYDMIEEFKNRPKPITAAEYTEKKKNLGFQAQLLMEHGSTIQGTLKEVARGNPANRRYRTAKNKEMNFRKDVMILEYHYLKLEEAYKYQGGNIIWHYFKFGCGILGCILSTCWVLQIILYVLERQLGYREIDLFLNNMLKGASEAAPLFATFLYIIFAFYLFFCVIKGNSSLGMRVFFLTIHPLKVNDTLMSGLVFNAGVILAASMPIGQFLSLSFADYGMLTQNSSIFGVQMQSLKGYNYAYASFIFLLLVCSLFTFFYYVCRPHKKRRENKLQFDYK